MFYMNKEVLFHILWIYPTIRGTSSISARINKERLKLRLCRMIRFLRIEKSPRPSLRRCRHGQTGFKLKSMQTFQIGLCEQNKHSHQEVLPFRRRMVPPTYVNPPAPTRKSETWIMEMNMVRYN